MSSHLIGVEAGVCLDAVRQPAAGEIGVADVLAVVVGPVLGVGGVREVQPPPVAQDDACGWVHRQGQRISLSHRYVVMSGCAASLPLLGVHGLLPSFPPLLLLLPPALPRLPVPPGQICFGAPHAPSSCGMTQM